MLRLASLVNRQQTSNMADTGKVQVKLEDGDPQSVQDLTGFVPFYVQHVVKSLKSILGDICCCVSLADTELRLF